jgi:hypothetical protein
MALVRLERYEDARDRLREAMSVYPDQPGFAHALARVLAAAPDDRARDGRSALELVQRLWAQQHTTALAETMAMALAEVGRFDEAAEWQRKAIAEAGREKRTTDLARLSSNLRRYEQRLPCREPWDKNDPVFHPRPTK